jgi:hypothetical protein
MSINRNLSEKKFVVVSQQAAKQHPYPYVFVHDDGTARELRPDEKTYLEEPFLPLDGGRPAIKETYTSKNGWGSIRGFCRRSLIPEELEILPAAAPETGLRGKNDPITPENPAIGDSITLEEENQTPPG